jgi:hypothetical protein
MRGQAVEADPSITLRAGLVWHRQVRLLGEIPMQVDHPTMRMVEDGRRRDFLFAYSAGYIVK